jgi:hypothetical protein
LYEYGFSAIGIVKLIGATTPFSSVTANPSMIRPPAVAFGAARHPRRN